MCSHSQFCVPQWASLSSFPRLYLAPQLRTVCSQQLLPPAPRCLTRLLLPVLSHLPSERSSISSYICRLIFHSGVFTTLLQHHGLGPRTGRSPSVQHGLFQCSFPQQGMEASLRDVLHVLGERCFPVDHFPKKGARYPGGVSASQQASWGPQISSRFQPSLQCREYTAEATTFPGPVLCSLTGPHAWFNVCCCSLKILNNFELVTLHFHFTLSPRN